jgi:hypothetical protein
MHRTYDFDADLILKDAGLVAADGAATVGGAAKVVTLGSGRIDGVVVLNVTAAEIASDDELYGVILQGSTVAAFTAGTIENLAQMDFGATEVRDGAAKDSTVGRYEMLFTTYQNGTVYPYVRLYNKVTGAIASGINYDAYIAKLPGK